MQTPPADWKPAHDPRSRAYPIRPNLSPALLEWASGSVHWNAGPALTQPGNGACVGYAFAAVARALGMMCAAPPSPAFIPSAGLSSLALHVFERAKELDAFPGTETPGTSVIAGAKALIEFEREFIGPDGYGHEYRWAFGLEDVVDALKLEGPVVLGLYWTEDMFRPVNGLMSIGGATTIGHCTVAIGYTHTHPLTGRPAVLIQNSYGPTWGIDGRAWIDTVDLLKLLQRQGEACVITSA